MPTTTISGREVEVDEEGFLARPEQWDEQLGAELARLIGITMTERHWQVVRFARADHAANGVTPTLNRVTTQTPFGPRDLFTLFPGKPAKKMAYVAGLPKPIGCV